MAGLPVVYPDTLPHPEVGQFTPRERRAINREFMRPISRDRAGTRTVAFTFTPVQAREFREWYQEWVTMGGGMFAALWPMPWGRGPHVFRFVEPPTWQLIGGGIDGQGYWRVTADVELRGRGEMPELEVFTITSQIYPVIAEDEVESSAAEPLDSQPAFWIDNAMSRAPVFQDGSLREPLIQYDNWPPEYVKSPAPPVLIDGLLYAPLIEYKNWPVEMVKTPSAPEMVDGTLRQILIQYTNWDVTDEEVTSSPPTLINGTLT